MDFKVNECGEIIRDSETPNDLAEYEDALLRGEKLKANIRRKVAKETRNEKVLWMCIRDTAITVVTAAKENPILTPEMKTAISKEEKAWEQLKQYKIQEEVRRLEELVDDFVDDDIEDLEQVEDNVKENDITAPNSNAKEYITGNLPIRFADSAMFSQGYYTDSVVEDIRAILDAEAPISRRLLIKRLINNYVISRNGVRINTYLTEVFEDMGLVTSGTEDIFYWKDKDQLDNYSGYRLVSEREALDISPEEVAQAILQVLKEQFAIDEEGLISETARLFGYASVRDNVLASMKRGIEYALKNSIIQFDGGRYK